MKLPGFIVDTLKLPDGRRIRVIRDDLLPGGSKQRALVELLQRGREYVYAAPVYGFAQIALALAARERKARVTLFVAKRKQLHPRTLRAQQAGARIVEVPFGMLSVTTARAREYAQTVKAGQVMAGFDTPEFHDAMSAIMRKAPIKPDRVWCCAGTGALIRAAQGAWPSAQFNAVQTGMRPTIGYGMQLWVAPETYARPARRPPTFPSCSNSDAKVWQFVVDNATDGDVFWNVAGD